MASAYAIGRDPASITAEHLYSAFGDLFQAILLEGNVIAVGGDMEEAMGFHAEWGTSRHCSME